MENSLRITASGIKREARALLNHNWSRALGALCVYLMVLVLFTQVSSLATALLNEYGPAAGKTFGSLSSFQDYQEYFADTAVVIRIAVTIALAAFFFLISSPLSLGLTYWYRNLIQLDNIQVGQIFRFYQSNERFKNAVIFQGLSLLIKLGYGILSFLPAVACFAYAYISGLSEESAGRSTLLYAAGAVLAAVGLYLYATLTLRFFFAKYLYCGEYGYDAMDCLRYSNRYMKGHIGGVVGVILSFAPWFLLCVLILPLVYVVPFYSVTMAAYAQDIIEAHMGQTLEGLKKR